MKSDKHLKRARKFIASGTQTYSKQSSRYVEGVYPAFLERGSGAYVWDDTGAMYIDYVASLGANLLGHSNPYVDMKVSERIRRGVLFSLPSTLEGDLAEQLNSLFPYMQKMRFLKSGSEAVSAGIKIARAYTGRELVLSIGYHGWHDWSSASSPKSAGSPSRLKPLCINLSYNDLTALREVFLEEGKYVACVVLEPYIFSEPDNNYLNEVFKLCRRYGSLVFFDEVVTGIRWQDWSVANYYELKPDLFALGKPLANGFPISVIGGRACLMNILDQDCFVSSTFGGDLVGITAALATLQVCRDEEVQLHIYETGTDLKESFNQLAKLEGVQAHCLGNPARLTFDFPSLEHRALFWQECLRDGVFFGYATHTTLAHTAPVINKTIDTIQKSLKTLKKHWERPGLALEGAPPVPVLTVASRR